MIRLLVKTAIVVGLCILAANLLVRCATNLGESIRDVRPADAEEGL